MCIRDSHILLETVKNRRTCISKKEYHEKLTYEASPYAAVFEAGRIEEALWNARQGTNSRSQFCWLQNRYCFLHTFGGILRHESIQNAELSDTFMVTMKKE